MGNIITKGPPLFPFRIQKFPRNKKYPDSPVHTLSDSLRIFILFLLWIAHLKISGFDSLSNSLDACGQKLYPERKQEGEGRGLTEQAKPKVTFFGEMESKEIDINVCLVTNY